MPDLKTVLAKYDYVLPKKLIALTPASPRDLARLLIYNRQTKKISFDRFSNLAAYLPRDAVLVFNQTKVLPARLAVTKSTGGKVTLLYIRTAVNAIEVMSNKKLKPGEKLTLNRSNYFTVLRSPGRYYQLKPSFALSKIEQVLLMYGKTPLPPYLHTSPLPEKKRRQMYQTIFAKLSGSIAAPTASLHFTKALLTKLKKQGIEIEYITLHVGLGTFAPLTQQQLDRGKLHQEFFTISQNTAALLRQSKKHGRPIIAVGTTVTRTLETFAKTGRRTGPTDLFIQEGFTFKMINGLITNFHVPKSSLLMLVSAFAGRNQIFKLYRKAISQKFRFFSFGDGMLIV